MLLNRSEKLMMNNPVRAAIQRRFEARRLLTMGGRMAGGIALEVGCGCGVGIELIFDIFGAESVDAFDLDPHMIELAARRLRARGDSVRLWTADTTAIPAASNRYDAVFDFGVIHHVPNWPDAIREVYRVLKPGGRFYAEDVLEKFICHPLCRLLLEHPLTDRFSHNKFIDALENAGFLLVATDQLWQCFGWFVADKPR